MEHPIWNKDVMYLKRVGPQRAQLLASECQIRTYRDLLHYYPRKYVDRSRVSRIGQLPAEPGFVTLVGKLTHLALKPSRKGRNLLQGTFSDGTGTVELVWFQGIKWIQRQFKVGEELALFGKPNRYHGQWQLTHPEMEPLNEEDGQRHVLQIVPFYPSNDKLGRLGLDARGFRSLLFQLLEEAAGHIPETLSPALCARFQLVSRREALTQIHYPRSHEALQAALRRLKFEEFFFFQLMLLRRRAVARAQHQSPPFTRIGAYFNTFFAEHMPFSLTGAQKRVLKEIRRDLAQPVQMNRLIQGDVGAGKTMVAFMTMLMARDNDFQSALMAPTAILAEQHFRKITAMAAKVGLKTGLLVGGQKKKERQAVLEGLASGETDIAIGTHALIEDPVVFHRLGLVVVDEQHKFGVVQRARLWKKATPFPHNMIMTATPIPRTLAMSVYGDVDVSIIDELPPGRKPIKTVVRGEGKRLEVFGFLRHQLQQGQQVYVVYPLVEESEKLDLLAVEKGFELMERYFTEYRIGIVHGRQKPEDKELEMQRFVKGETHILVSTTVIEVGVDVANATVMVIENAERFGLSQLHQLRGRVGRGSTQSYCILMAGQKLSADGKRRLKAMQETNDGFRISEIDLELRGPGDFLGTRQSGLPEFQLANLVEDRDLLALARQAAGELTAQDPQLAAPEHQSLRFFFEKYVKRNIGLGTVA
ncbi:MAG: ATP-dependent DNA helicase RecG [Bacteroidetes bacterium]|nr:MAG: ATP-dependent DNA helicase RecG [Bacteroidota bacterium]